MIMRPSISLTGEPLDIDDSIVVCGDLIDIGARVFKWNEPEGFNGYTKKRVVVENENRKTGRIKRKVISGPRYDKRPCGIDDVTQFFVHHSGGDGRNPSGMYETLYNTRKLSVHFAVEDDGRIYQFNDVVERCWHAGGHNRIAVGVECCLYPDAAKRPNYYSAANRKRTGNLQHQKAVDVIHGRERKVFCFTEPQVDALARLAAGTWIAVEIAQGIDASDIVAPRFPRDANGAIPRTVVQKAKQHVGLIGHLQCTPKKWDPAGFPWEKFEALVAHYIKQFLRVGASYGG